MCEVKYDVKTVVISLPATILYLEVKFCSYIFTSGITCIYTILWDFVCEPPLCSRVSNTLSLKHEYIKCYLLMLHLLVMLCCPLGGAGDKLLMPGTGFLTVGAASTLAFCQVLREEYPELSCKLNQVPLSQGSTLLNALKHPIHYRCTVASQMFSLTTRSYMTHYVV